MDLIQEVIDDLLLPSLFGQYEPLPNEVRQLVTLTTAQGGLGIPDLKSEVPQQFAASTVNNNGPRGFHHSAKYLHGDR